MPVVDAFFDWGSKIYSTFARIVGWFSTEIVSIGGLSLSVIEVVIGGGLTAVLVYLFVKFAVPL